VRGNVLLRPKKISQSDNPWYPLPADYPSLSEDGQKQARVNATRQWLCTHSTRQEHANAYVASLRFFDSYYLWPDHDPSVEFDPGFYDDDPLPSPVMHYDIARQWGTNRLCITIAPRGSAKSFLIRKSMMMELASKPRRSIIYATSSNDNTMMCGNALKVQFDNNERINDDFAILTDYDNLKPARGERPWGAGHFELRTGSWLRCISAESKQRGGRPQLYVLDDPEYDPKASTSMEIIRDYMQVLVFKVVLPMVMRRGTGCRWLATFVSKRHYAWHAMSVDNHARSIDSRFDNWDRMIIRSEYEDKDGNIQSCWPEMWPATIEQKKELAAKYDDQSYLQSVSLEEIKEQIGLANYLSEYMARPGDGDEVYFPELREEDHGYVITGTDEDPWSDQARILWHHRNEEGEFVRKNQTLPDFLRQSRMFMTVDTSYTSGPDSDSKVCCVMAINADNDLFVLDMWAAKATQQTLITEVMAMAEKWKCPSIHVEAIKEGITVYNDLTSIVSTRDRQYAGMGFLPRIAKFNPGFQEKVAKISSLLRRFELAKIKFPLTSRMRKPWSTLFNQIAEFNPEAPDGGLQHDDEIDSVAMSMFVIRGRVGRPVEAPPPDTRSPLQKMKDGELRDAAGMPLAQGIDWRNVTFGEFMEVMGNMEEARSPKDGSSVF
jgi:phage terminase large subunit-like protein